MVIGHKRPFPPRREASRRAGFVEMGRPWETDATAVCELDGAIQAVACLVCLLTFRFMTMSESAETLWHDLSRQRQRTKATPWPNVSFKLPAEDLDAARELEAVGYLKENRNPVGGWWTFGLTRRGEDALARLCEVSRS
jgi:hypothetical protein